MKASTMPNLIKRTFLLGVLAVGPVALAHEGHGVPGALPPPPNGGVVEEAKHTVAHAHDGKEAELFFEATYKDKTLKVYPLLLKPDNTSVYSPLSPKEMEKVEVKIELPRKKATETLKVSVGQAAIEAPFDSKGANRFIVHVSALHNKEVKTAKLQIEKN